MTKFWLNYGVTPVNIVVDEDDNVLMHTHCPCCPCERCDNASLPSVEVTFTGFSNTSNCTDCGDANNTFTLECNRTEGSCRWWLVDPGVCDFDRIELKLTLYGGNNFFECTIGDTDGSGSDQSVVFTHTISGSAVQNCCAWDELELTHVSVSADPNDACSLSSPTCKITAKCCSPPA